MKKYYSLDKIQFYGNLWNIILGQKSNGKTYATIREGLEQFFKTGKAFVYLRRYKEELSDFNIYKVFAPHYEILRKYTEYNDFVYYRRRIYAVKKENGETVKKLETPIAFTYSLTSFQNDNGGDFGSVSQIVFDECITYDRYLNDEFIKLMTVISNIVRDRTDTKIYLLGNTVNVNCPLLREFGIIPTKLEKGKINLVHFPNSEIVISVEWCEENNVTADVAKELFSFSERANALTKTGDFVTKQYKSLDNKYMYDTLLTIKFDVLETEIKGEIVTRNGIRKITFSNWNNDTDIFDYMFTEKDIDGYNIFKSWNAGGRVTNLIVDILNSNNAYFNDNMTGDIMQAFFTNRIK